MRHHYAVAALLATAGWGEAAAQQQLPFTVTIVDWEREAWLRQGQAYRAEASGREVLFCVDSWTRLPVTGGIERIVIKSVRRVRGGNSLAIVDIGAECVGSNHEVLPMLHTHADGNCQFSPVDLITVVARRAPFEGVQCGERHFNWAFAWQVLAIANSVELAKLNRPPNE